MTKLEEYEKLVEAQKQYRESSIAALKDEIAAKLKPEYQDFYETSDIPMTDMLGEIYKAKLNQIAKILAGYGIDVRS